MARKHKRLTNFRKMARNANGKIKDAVDDIVSGSLYYKESITVNTVGDDNADGTALCSITLADGKVFICTKALGSANLSSMLSVVTSTTAAVGGTETDRYFIDCQNIGINGESSDSEHPLFVYNNTSGSTVYVNLYAKEIGWGAADDDNNAATKRFYAILGGYIV